MTELDIVIPLYKSGSYVPDLVQRLDEWVRSRGMATRVIFVDDGSQDGTYEVLQRAVGSVSFEALPLQLATNYGQHTATAVGLHYATAPLVATIDDDLQHDPFQLDAMIETLRSQHADLVYGIYNEKKHSFFRNLGSRILKKILFSGGNDYTSVTSFRLMRPETVAAFKSKHFSVLFVDEYLMRYASHTTTCQVAHEQRKKGVSTYSGWKLLKLALGILLFHSSMPLKLITRFGLLMSLVFFTMGCYFIYRKMVYDTQLGFTSLIVAIFFSTGLIMLSLGIIGEYVRKIWISQNQLDKVIVIGQK